MADIADVMDTLESIALNACYPSGTDQASISGRPIDIAQGWVIAADLDAGLTAGTTFVSIYAIPSSTSKLPVPLATSGDGVIVAPVHGMGATATDSGFVLTGAPGVGEYATVRVGSFGGDKVYSYAAVTGDTIEVVGASLANAISVDFPGTSWLDGAVTIPHLSSLIVRIGAPATMGEVIDRQRQNIMIGVWAPTVSDRTVVGRALQVAVAQNLTIDMPDTSTAILVVQGVNLTDKQQNELAYRRDLTVQCQWDTVEEYPAYEVTAVNIRLPSATGPTFAY